MILDFLIHKLTENKPPELNKDKCINSYNTNVECSICRESCQENAVNIKDKRVIINESKCNQCGICQVKCPTQAISIRGTGEDGIFFDAGEKRNLVFSCSFEDAMGNLNISCLNALHSEFITSLFILHNEKEFHFNLSKCENCEYEITLFQENLNKAISFVKALGLNPIYKIHSEENNLSELITEEISRRNLFKLVKKESVNVAAKALNTIIDEENNKTAYRNILLNSIKNLRTEDEINYPNIYWEYWDVNIDCDGCSKCIDNCPGKAWQIENDDKSLKLYYTYSNCYKCGLCEYNCPKKAIAMGNFNSAKLSESQLIKEIHLNTCKECNKKFIPFSEDDDKCDVCKKKELLRKKITSI